MTGCEDGLARHLPLISLIFTSYSFRQPPQHSWKGWVGCSLGDWLYPCVFSFFFFAMLLCFILVVVTLCVCTRVVMFCFCSKWKSMSRFNIVLKFLSATKKRCFFNNTSIDISFFSSSFPVFMHLWKYVLVRKPLRKLFQIHFSNCRTEWSRNTRMSWRIYWVH